MENYEIHINNIEHNEKLLRTQSQNEENHI